MMSQTFWLLGAGCVMTCYVWAGAALIALPLGTFVGIIQSKRISKRFIFSFVFKAWTYVVRAVPAYVQLLFVYFAVPELIGLPLSAPLAGILTLGICSSAYVSQIVQGAIDAIDEHQWEAAADLGSTGFQTVRLVILPQIFQAVAPSLEGEMDQLLKSTSLLSTLGVLEVTRSGMNIIARNLNPLEIYAAVALCYLLMTCVRSFLLYLFRSFLAKNWS